MKKYISIAFLFFTINSKAQKSNLNSNATYGQRYLEQIENNTAKPNAPLYNGGNSNSGSGGSSTEMFEKGYRKNLEAQKVKARVDGIKFREMQETLKIENDRKELQERVANNYLYNKELKQKRELTLNTKYPLFANSFSINSAEAREVAEIQYYFQYNGIEFPYDDYEAAGKSLFYVRNNIDKLAFDSLVTLLWQGSRYALTAIECVNKLRNKFPQKADTLDRTELRMMVNFFGGYRSYFYDDFDNNYPTTIFENMGDAEQKKVLERFKTLSAKYPKIANLVAGSTRSNSNPYTLMIEKKSLLQLSDNDIFDACKKSLFTNYSSDLQTKVKREDWKNYIFNRVYQASKWLVKNKLDYLNSLTVTDWINIGHAQNVELIYFQEPFRTFNEKTNNFEYSFKALNDAINGVTMGGKKISSTTYKFDDGTIYTGEFKEDIFEGKGIITYADGEKYTGNFINNVFDGIGTYIWKNGSKYEGDYKKGLRQGNGKYYYNDGSFYNGQWSNSLKDGKGTMIYFNKDEYDGYWKNDVRDSVGTYKYADGKVYTGGWKNNLFNGKGEMKYKEGHSYVGNWEYGKHNGFGTKTFPSNDSYSGYWKDNKKQGKGTYKYSNGDMYVGEFVDDLKEGYGEFISANGNIYKGSFVNNKRDGKGTFNSGDSVIYVGEYKNGFKHGNGKISYSDGSYYDGQFKLGKMDGIGIIRYTNGDTYTGNFKDDVRNGKGIIKFVNGITYQGEYANDQRNGIGIYTKANGCYMEGTFKNNLRDVVKYYNKQGQEITKEEYEKN